MATPVKGGTTVTASSNAEGKFEIKGLAEGKHKLTVGRNNAGWIASKAVEAETGKKDVQVVVEEGLSISGSVVDGTGKGIANAWVSVRGGSYGWSRTGADGSFRVTGLQPGAVKIQVWANGANHTLDAVAGDQGIQIRAD
jgi:protocatechuate 3,4-dioxygenase beta subunit